MGSQQECKHTLTGIAETKELSSIQEKFKGRALLIKHGLRIRLLLVIN